MTTEQTAQQLELAAQILRTGHPFEVRHDNSDRWHASLGVNPAQAVLQNWCLRPVLAAPPDNRPLHNPDNLTAEQVGVGYRLALKEEPPHEDAERWEEGEGVWESRGTFTGAIYGPADTYRLPLSVPWPEPADPYAELKAAHAAGKVIQYRATRSDWSDWPKDQTPDWLALNTLWRIKPEPAFQLPPPPPGMRWHREDGWESDDLPSGYRPLVDGENWVAGDEILRFAPHGWQIGGTPGDILDEPTHGGTSRCRTTRPLVFNHAGKTWTYHRPGDPMPCDGERKVFVVFQDGDATQGQQPAEDWSWGQYVAYDTIIGWRYADEKKNVPLGPEDVPPGSVFRAEKSEAWFSPTRVTVDGIHHANIGQWIQFTYFTSLHQARYEINRSLSKGQWNPDAWEPCSKEIPA